MIFPKFLDEAKVLYFSPQGNYGEVCFTTGEIADHICYLAICKYQDDNSYYLFGCNAHFEVVCDSPWGCIEECMHIATTSYEKGIYWITME